MMLQLCYASERIESEQELLQDLSDILATARKFNLQHQIHGGVVLFPWQIFPVP